MNRRPDDIAKERRHEFTWYCVAVVVIIVFMVIGGDYLTSVYWR